MSSIHIHLNFLLRCNFPGCLGLGNGKTLLTLGSLKATVVGLNIWQVSFVQQMTPLVMHKFLFSSLFLALQQTFTALPHLLFFFFTTRVS